MATITFSATHDGDTVTRTSGTMPYVAAVFGDSLTWHRSFAAAHKAASSRQHTWNSGKPGTVVPVIPVRINGKIGADFAEGGWGDIPESVLAPLVAEKLGL